ncbi:MAG: hypothetical protein KGY40_03450 [Thioalkalivibrio sp.]|nr:hypothetical protein [Thioalkalivibrio sp.]
MGDWTQPAGILRQLQRRWERGEILAARMTGTALFPLDIPLTRPRPRDVTADFGQVMDWVAELRKGERSQRGYGYALIWETQRNRVHGSNPLPRAARIPDADDALRLLGHARDARRFDALVAETCERCPALLDWVARRPLTALDQADAWNRVLTVVEWFRAHPRPGLYLRQLDIPGVDTKFIEARRRLLAELLDLVLPAAAVDTRYTGARGFEARYGLRTRPVTLRLRLLDPALHLHGLSDLSAPVDELAQFDPSAWPTPVERVFIAENEINGLAFPRHPRALVIFGLGYAVEHLDRLPWLQGLPVHYWGDLDTHGFAILDRVRTHLPRAQSLLMDRATLETHHDLWGQEPADRRHTRDLTRLTPAEDEVFRLLRDNIPGDRVRLEQERIPYGWLRRALQHLD